MPAHVVAYGHLLVLGEDVEVREDVVDRPVGERRPLQGGVRVVDVGLVVLVVVDAHRRLVDVRLERGVVVGERRYLERHLGSFPSCVEANGFVARAGVMLSPPATRKEFAWPRSRSTGKRSRRGS